MLGLLAGLVLALFSTIFTAAAIGKTGGETLPSFNWSRLLAMAPQLDHHLMTLAAFVFVLVGYGAKAASPMHTGYPMHTASAVAYERDALRRH